MAILPVSISMIVTGYSSISFLANPVELYYVGVVYWATALGYSLAMVAVAHVMAPVFHKMKVVSANEVRSYTVFL